MATPAVVASGPMRNHFVIVALVAIGCSGSSARDKAVCSGWTGIGGESLDGQPCEKACADSATVAAETDLGMCNANTVGDPNLISTDMKQVRCDKSFEFDGEIGCCYPALSQNSDVLWSFAICK